MIKLILSGVQSVLKAFSKVREATQLYVYGRRLNALLLENVRRRFKDQVSPTGEPWIRSKAADKRKDNNRGTLYDTGRLYRSLNVVSKGNRRFVTSRVAYAKTHDLGLKGMPVRKFMAFSQSDIEDANGLWNEVMQGAGAGTDGAALSSKGTSGKSGFRRFTGAK